MADNSNPYGTSKSLAVNLLPGVYKTDPNKRFLQATIDQLIQPGVVKKVNGYIGRENAKATTGSDIFIKAADQVRQDYQLEPGFTVNDTLGNNTFFRDYLDYINQLQVLGANVSNHARLNKEEFYSWDPHIDWDKFVNFQDYYWLPYGPETITIYGQTLDIASTFSINLDTEGSNYQLVFTPDGLTPNPTIKLYRGQTYTFNVNSVGEPVSIRAARSLDNLEKYNYGVSQQSVESGNIIFQVPVDAPSILYYQSDRDISLGGVFEILSIDNDTFIDVASEILGKKTYTLNNGLALSNGMKVSFGGNVTPAEYATGEYYVEGVGSAITLINKNILEVTSTYSVATSILFDSDAFDETAFSDTTAFAQLKDYVIINRASNDHNPWSRYNRWFHKDVISASAIFNGHLPDTDQAARAIRPIIEFQSNLKLFNFGTTAIVDIDLVDNFTTDVFSTIEGTKGYNIDGVSLAQGQKILFTADKDPLVTNNIYQVEFIDVLHSNSGSKQIHLVEVAQPSIDQVVLVKTGTINQGVMYWYNGSTWVKAQSKTRINQPPLFDIVDTNGNSFGDLSVYDGSSFRGTKLFSYVQNLSATPDIALGFGLSYKNISNIGDILFNFNLMTDTFQYKNVVNVKTIGINTGFLLHTTYSNTVEYLNGWQVCTTSNRQAALRIYKNSKQTNNFNVDIFDDITALSDLTLKIYINGVFVPSNLYQVIDTTVYKQIVLNTEIASTDVLTIKAYSAQPINNNGYYEIPVNLQNNPLNEQIVNFTLGEVIDHVSSIVENLTDFSGIYPGPSNIRDLGNITQYGTKFVQHSGPASLSLYHITTQTNNVIRAIEQSRDDYVKFKKIFISTAESLGSEASPREQVDAILNIINADKTNNLPYYFSDMVPYGTSIETTLTVIDYRIQNYPLNNVFTLDTLSASAVGVYVNGTQLIYERDYVFNTQGFVTIISTLNNGDTITIYEYESTDGSYIPETPTKLGIYPKFVPQIYTDTTLISPRTVIQGHDGSVVLSYGDYRDNLILELEKRIFNNIKVKYDPTIFNIHSTVPGYNRTTDYSISEYNEILGPLFYHWVASVNQDFTKNYAFDIENPFTYNFRSLSSPSGTDIPGYWRGIYRYFFDTDRPNLCPWEMLGFTIQPSWWVKTYGPAPYTSDNLVMWTDIANGIVKGDETTPSTIAKEYVRPYLINHIPVDADGNLIDPAASGLAYGTITDSISNKFIFGDMGPVEGSWRRSSHYPFSVLISSILANPAGTISVILDRNSSLRNKSNQIVYSSTNLAIQPKNIILPSIASSSTRVQTSGLVNFIVNYILSDSLKSYKSYQYDLANLQTQLSHRVGAFTSKEKFNLILDSKTPLSSGSVFVPQENYNIILNTSSPVRTISYSGVVITKLNNGYEIRGYNRSKPYFVYYPYLKTGANITIGGISESYTDWSANQNYVLGKIVKYKNQYYKVTTTHTSSTDFNKNFFAVLGSLPIIGGQTANFRSAWDRTTKITVPYGSTFNSVQDVVDFLLGYGEYLKDQGFIFDDFNGNLNAVTNWETSSKEFLFWTTQNWSSGQDKWGDWIPNTSFAFNDIVRYNGNYYKAIRNVLPDTTFQISSFLLLDGLNNVGSSVISLSPAADKISFNASLSVVDDIRNQFNGYEIYKVDGTPLEAIFINSYREDNAVSYSPRTQDGIYGATFYLIQHEHVVLLDNSTIFNDTIYNPPTGYKQDRIKVSGYVSVDWYGGFNIPGFILDTAKIVEWVEWTDYNLGDIVKQKEFYYTASKFLPGSQTFVDADWIRLDKKPSTQLLPNWTYKAGQFTDFYSLDSDNFDSAQQKVAQHLIGYQKRQYLENIIQDDVSEFKFYQGMIREKGTQNVLNKLFDVLSADNQESLTFYEEWAIRVGQYGASRAFENIEFTLDETKFLSNPQGFELVNEIPYSIIDDFIIRQTPNDIYLKPFNYDSAPWPVLTNDSTLLNDAGYVRSSEVFKTLSKLSDIVGIDPATNAKYDIPTFVNGCYIQVAFENNSWNVYKFTNTHLSIQSVTYASSVLTFVTSELVPLSVGDYIGVSQVSTLNGFYQVTSINLNSFTVSASITGFPNPFTQQSQIIIHKFVSQRIANLDMLDNIIDDDLSLGQKVWVDNSSTTDDKNWLTLTYAPVYSQTNIVNTYPKSVLGFGRTVAINKNGNIAITSMNTGEVRIWDKAGQNSPWIERQTILLPIELTNLGYTRNLSTVLAISDDANWLAIGSPMASNVPTRFLGQWNSGTAYIVGDIVQTSYANYTPTFYQAIADSTAGTNPTTSPLIWKKIYYIPLDTSGTASAFSEQGIISLYSKDANNIFTLVDHIVSPEPGNLEQFGSSIVFSNNSMYVSAPEYSQQAGHTGIVRRFNYATIINAQSPYNPVGSSNNILALTSTAGISAGMDISGTGFTNQYVVSVINSTQIEISLAPTSTPDGIIKFTTTEWVLDSENVYLSPLGTSSFGNKVNVSSDNAIITITGINNSIGYVYIYADNTPTQSLIGTDVFFGISSSLTSSGKYLAVGDIATTITKINQGVVYVYELNSNNEFILYQQLTNHFSKSSGYFGTNLAFMNDENTLVVYSQDEDTSQSTTFDNTNVVTTFDKKSTRFTALHINSGRVDVYDRYLTKWVYSESLQTSSQESDGYGLGFAVGANHILVGAPYSLDSSLDSGAIYDYYKPYNAVSWNTIHYKVDKPDITKIKKAFLYNNKTGTLIRYLDVIDVSQGKIAGIADEEIKYKTFYDPAVYSNSDGTRDIVVDSNQPWTKAQVGMLWWDLRTAKFIDAYDNDVIYRNSSWNTLAAGSTIDIYEWVETSLLPAQWDAQADTVTGLTANISGKSLYGNSVYSVRTRFDTLSQKTKYTYYFWVKNKVVIPNIAGRNISASDVASLIANPRGYNYPYLALTGINSFSLVNVASDLSDQNVVLSVEYWTIDNVNQNIHNQYKLISNDPLTVLPKSIEQKWIDSLCGTDVNGREVPDSTLPPKLQYGIENRPRQGMFVNRFEALKEFVEHANNVLSKNQTSLNRNISNLKSYDKPPSVITGLYDLVKTTEIEIPLINTGAFKSPVLGTPNIIDGKIIDIPVVFAGRGYLYAPYITITGTGINARARAEINSAGQVTSIKIISSGEGYDNNTVASIRNFSVLVESDSQAEGFWTIYSYNPATLNWTRYRTQSYDVRNFWSYTDWYEQGFNQFSPVDFAVDNYYGLNSVSTKIGQIVKIRNANAGGWSLLEKYQNSTSADWTQSYHVVGLQNGTIQLKNTLYQSINTSQGFDGSIYDNVVYDNSPNKELRIILQSLKNDIFIDDLKQNYLDLFFTTVRYALSEQLYLDWIFKTSFIKSKHNLGGLDQPVTYRPDNLRNFQDYISEVVPYRTTVREYVSAFSGTDVDYNAVSDFDIPPIYENGTDTVINTFVQNGKIEADDASIQQAPWKNWLSTVGFTVLNIPVVNGGSGYISPPVVTITSDSGTGATARAFISSGVVNNIVLLTPGSGYLSAPTVTLSGGLSVGGTQASAVAIIGNSLVRNNLIKIKFDRTTYSYYVTKLAVQETFNTKKISYPLTWAPDIKIGTSTVYVNGVLVLRDSYTLKVITSKVNGYTQYSGLLQFTEYPNGSNIVVNYLKNEEFLNAADRIQFYYNSGEGLAGSDLAQLMTGVDYGGVIVEGMSFDVATGWGTLPYYSDKWDSADPTFTDYIVTVKANTTTFTLPYTPVAGTQLNIYYIQKNIDTGISDGENLIYPYNLYDDNLVTTAEFDTTSITIETNYTFSGGNYLPSTTLHVVSTTGIKSGMTVYGTGFIVDPNTHRYTQTVVSVVNSTTLILSGVPHTQPNGTLSFTFNAPGSAIIQLADVSGVEVGDAVEISSVMAFGADTVVSAIDYVNNIVTLNQILYNVIPKDTVVTFTRPLDVNFFNYTVRLSAPLVAGTKVIVSGTLPSIRLDDPNFGSDLNTNINAVMVTPVANGSTNIITIPSNYPVYDGDKFIIRQSTSDGSVKPLDKDYDTSLDGGNMAYSTATGVNPEDIIVDGDDLVSATSSPAPEEVVPGQVVDALAIKVYDQPNSGSANVKVDKYIGDGITTSFAISQTPNNPRAIIVKDNTSFITYSTDYTIDYKNKSINFNNAPISGHIISIYSLGFNGSNLLDIDYFIGDGTTTEFLTKAPWLTHETSLVYVNGVPATVELFKTDSSYESANRTGIRFGLAPALDSIINYVIVSGSQQTFSVMQTEKIVADGTNTTYGLSYPVGTTLPSETNILVRVDQTILSAPVVQYYTVLSNVLSYTVDKERAVPYSITIDKILVYVNGVQLNLGTDYTIDLGGITVNITKANATIYAGQKLAVSITQNNGYAYLPETRQIVFNNVYNSSNNIEVISFYKHDILDIERTAFTITNNISYTPDSVKYFEYKSFGSGLIPLDRTVLNDSYVWVIHNNTLLVPSIDYKITDNKSSVQLAATPNINDVYTLITFSSNILVPGIAYMQFKDMLNRVQFKRLSKNKQTRLATDLHYNDIAIQVIDASNFDTPNPSLQKPGIIEIAGERIEFFQINGNTLSQLRRGTLGTGTPRVHPIGTPVQDIGASETIPYTDTNQTFTVISDGTNVVNLPFAPMKAIIESGKTYTSRADWNYASGYTSTIPSSYNIQADDIEVFVGGYDTAIDWKPNVTYAVGTIVIVASYSYRCTESHTSSTDFLTDKLSYWTFFIGNIRLKKKPYKVHNETVAPYSPAGDVQLDADFAVDGINSRLWLTNVIPEGTLITIVRRTGTSWDSSLNIQYDTTNISEFLKATPGIWYQDKVQVTSNSLTFTGTFDNSSVGFDDSADQW